MINGSLALSRNGGDRFHGGYFILEGCSTADTC